MSHRSKKIDFRLCRIPPPRPRPLTPGPPPSLRREHDDAYHDYLTEFAFGLTIHYMRPHHGTCKPVLHPA